MKRFRLRSWVLASALVVTAAVAHAAFRSNGAAVNLSVAATAIVGPSETIGITGDSDSFTVTDSGTQLLFSTNLSKLDLGAVMTNQFRHAFEVNRFPQATLTIPVAKLPRPAVGTTLTAASISANFNLHGVTKPVTVVYTLKRTSQTAYELRNAGFTFNYRDFRVPEVCFLARCVQPTVSVRLPRAILIND